MNQNPKLLLAVLLSVLLLMGEMTEAQRRGGGKRRKTGSRKAGRFPLKTLDKASREYYNSDHAAKITYWSHFESEYILGRKIVFMCTAKGVPVPQFTWYKDGIELYAHSFFQVHEWLTNSTIKSKMEIDPATQMDAGYYECQADNKFAVDFKGFRTDYSILFD